MYISSGSGKYPSSTRRPLRVAFFLGSDITSHLIVNRLIPILLEKETSLQLYLTRGKLDPRRPQALQDLFFLEHVLLQDHVYPFIDAWGVPQPARCNTPAGWLALSPDRIAARQVEDVNDSAFVAHLATQDIDLAVSVRCYQKFRPPILKVLGADPDRAFVNLHPGLLPYYRGVNTFFWSMLRDEPEAGFTLHHLSEDWDTGPIIKQARFPLDYSRSVVENMLLHTADAAGLILDLARRMAAGQPTQPRVQDESQARYFSHPEAPDLEGLAARGLDMFHASAVIDQLVDAFFETVPETAQFREALISAIAATRVPCGYVRRQVAEGAIR